MNLEKILDKALQDSNDSYHLLDRLYTQLDKEQIRRTKNIRLIPTEDNRRGGKYSYAEWAHVIGIFQTLMYFHLKEKDNNNILDIGCGTGLLGIASEPFLGNDGRYFGIDVMKKDIDFCRQHYPSENTEFIHLDVQNSAYSPELVNTKQNWPIESMSMDLVTALSVWTHFKEEDAIFYFKEVERVLKPGGKAIITFFMLDETYRDSLNTRTSEKGKFSTLPQNRWIFDQPSYGSNAWFHPVWANVPESAIGVTEEGMERIISGSGMTLINCHQGSWKEIPGLYFQDVLIFQKS